MKKSRVLFIAGIIAIIMYNRTNSDDINILPSDDNDLSVTTGGTYVEEYITMCDNVDANYKFEECYISDDEIVCIVDDVIQSNRECYNDELDKDFLISNIISNTNYYVEQKDGVYNAFDLGNIYLEINPENLNTIICDTIWDSLNDDSSDIYENYCAMSDIKIVINNDIDDAVAKYIGRVSSESEYWDEIDSNTIMINMDTVIEEYKYKKIAYEDDPILFEDPGSVYDYFKMVLKHEINHVMQHICSCRYEAGQLPNSIEIYYNSYDDWDNIGNSIIEASAESSMYANNVGSSKNSSYVYDDYRKNESLLFLLSIFKTDINEYYNAVKNTSFSDLYDFFGLNSDEDFNNFYKSLYAMEASSEDNNFIERVEKVVENDSEKYDEDSIGYNYTIDIYKLFIKNLIEYSFENEDFSFEDSIFLNEFAKTILLNVSCNFSFEYGKNTGDWDDDIVMAFLELDEIFYSYVGYKYDVSREDIEIERDNQQEVLVDIIVNREELDNVSDKTMLEKFPIIKNILFPHDFYLPEISDEFDNNYSDDREDVKEFVKNY